ncbi:hypothetical protein ACTI_25110 [Actinoplanes sp. OR16]|nr:hypothetical protein ACTI_25110 [Actinoplanes sp. OR16]
MRKHPDTLIATVISGEPDPAVDMPYRTRAPITPPAATTAISSRSIADDVIAGGRGDVAASTPAGMRARR